MPPHNGHRYLLDFAAGCVDRLSVLVCTMQSDSIAGTLRYEWMKEMFPNINVVHMTEENPEARKGSPNSYRIWADAVLRYAGPVDYVFASEDYGFRLAEELDASYIPVDPSRRAFPVSATMVRRNPMGSWPFIPSCVRPYFARRVYVLSEQPGESDALLEHLADHFRTVYAGDYLAYHAERTGSTVIDPAFAVRAQIATENAIAKQADRILLSATDPVHVWMRLRALAESDGAPGASGVSGAGGVSRADGVSDADGVPRAGGVSGAGAAPLGEPPKPRPKSEWARLRYLINPPTDASTATVYDPARLPVLARTLEFLAEQGADVRVLAGSPEERFTQAMELVDEMLLD